MSPPERPASAVEFDRTRAALTSARGEGLGVPPQIGGYEIIERAGAGAMGTVYRARSLATGAAVAVKVARIANAAEGKRAAPSRGERLAREGRALAELRHPNIVTYVDAGEAEGGEAFLVMEWLSGEDLAARLSRGALGEREALALALKVAGALAYAHARGVLHRDLKPSNLFLPDGDIERVKLIDFGLARALSVSGAFAPRALTAAGSMLGTPAYMAPEQARGEARLGPRADLFSLGCVLFECLAGRPPFVADHPLAIAAKVLFEEPPPPSRFCPEIPEALDKLVRCLLEKSPDRRPASAPEVMRALTALSEESARITFVGGGAQEAEPSSVTGRSLTAAERQLACVVLVAEGGGSAGALVDATETDVRAAALATTEDASAAPNARWSLRAVAVRHGARLEALPDGSLAAALTGATSASELASRAARCALAVRARFPSARVALATGWGVTSGGTLLGGVIDRASAELSRAAASGARVCIDATTADLLGDRFELERSEEGPLLVGEREAADEARVLLGKPTPFVGREREQRSLLSLFDECVSEPVARVALVVGPTGVGKSRLRQEFLRQIKEQRALRGEGALSEVWLARGDPMSAGAPLALIASALRAAFGLGGAKSPEARALAIAERVRERLPASEAPRVAEFLGELVSVTLNVAPSIQLAAARESPILMGDQIHRAFEDYLRAACEVGPVVLVLEDIHWGDLPTARLVSAALRNLADKPFFVLVLARPEVDQVFPSLFRERDVCELRLGPLNRKASERLVREALGAAAAEDRIAKLVDRACGNAFFLEELIRVEAAGGGDLPETVLAIVQARLSALPDPARHLLRAASVFGASFTREGVAHLLGGGSLLELDAWLSDLIDREIVTRRSPEGAAAPDALAFRNSLLRDAAYAALTADDRRAGHLLAGEWLAGSSAAEALVLAEHFERGGQGLRAVQYYQLAAEEALAGDDLAGAIQRAERGYTCGATGEALGALRLLQATAHNWLGAFAQGERCALSAISWLTPGSARYYDALERLAWTAEWLGGDARLRLVEAHLEATSPDQAATRSWLIAWAAFAEKLFLSGQNARGAEVLARVEAWQASAGTRDLSVMARVHFVRALRARGSGALDAYVRSLADVIACYEEAGDVRNAALQRSNAGGGLMELGAFERGAEILRLALADADRMGSSMTASLARHDLGVALGWQGSFDEARALLTRAHAAFAASENQAHAVLALASLARVLLRAGDVGGALARAREAVPSARHHPAVIPVVLAAFAEVELSKGAAREALGPAVEAQGALDAALESAFDVTSFDAFVRLVHAEARHRAGDVEGSRRVIRVARDRLLARAAAIEDPEMRVSFLKGVPDHARTLALAEVYGGEGEGR